MLLVVASMVGTGVFTTTGLLVHGIRSVPAVLLCWVVGGVVALSGALSYAELVAAMPANGGEYQLLSRIYRPWLGFACGWTSLVVGFAAPTAASGIAFGKYVETLWPGVPPLASALVLVLGMSILHAARLELGSNIQNVFTAVKIVLIVAFVCGGLFTGEPARLAASERPIGAALGSPGFAVGLIFVSFAYSGWNAAAYIAGELRRPERAAPIALLAGTAIVALLYVGLNVVFLAAAPASALDNQIAVGHIAATSLFGDLGGKLLTALIALGLVSTVGSFVMTGPRVAEAMGLDYPRLRRLSVRTARGGPIVAIAAQAAIACVMIATASFDALLQYIGVTLSVFAMLTVAGVVVERFHNPAMPRPYRTWGYPVTPAIFIGVTLWSVYYTVRDNPLTAVAAACTVGAGVLVYRWAAGSPARSVS